MGETATLTVIRRAAHPNRLRAYGLLLDDAQVGVVKNDQAFSTTVPAGAHTLVAKVDWVRSLPLQLDCAPGATVFVHCETSADPLEILKAVLGRPSTHLTLSVADSAALPVPDEAQRRQSVARRATRAAIWFTSVLVLGLALAVLVDSDSVPAAVNAQRQELIGQATGLIAILGAFWTFLRRPKAD